MIDSVWGGEKGRSENENRTPGLASEVRPDIRHKLREPWASSKLCEEAYQHIFYVFLMVLVNFLTSRANPSGQSNTNIYNSEKYQS